MSGRILAVLALSVVTIFLGGCMGGNGGEDATYKPRVREFLFKVSEASDSTMDVYEKNDGTYSKVVAIGFMSLDQETLEVPNPTIRVKEGDTVIIQLENTNALSHTIHLHGGLVPWEMDGVDYLTQFPVMQGETFTYRYENVKAGTYFYHCHVDGPHHQDLGMYGAFIVEEVKPPVKVDRDFVVMLDEVDNCHVHGNTDPATNQEQTGNIQDNADCMYRFVLDNIVQNRALTSAGGTVNNTVPDPVGDAYCAQLRPALANVPEPARSNALLAAGCTGEHGHNTPPTQTPREWWFETHPSYAPKYNTFILNGKAFPDTPVFPVKEGETARFRLINAGNEMHSMHWHGHKVQVIARDGYLLDSPFYVDTLGIMPGERYDVIMEADNPGLWLLHDHVGTQTMNDNQHPGGIMSCIAYDGWEGVKASELTRSLDCNTKAVEILEARGGQHPHGGQSGGASALAPNVAASTPRVSMPPPLPGTDRPSAADYIR